MDDIVEPEHAELTRIAALIDWTSGTNGKGLTVMERSRLFALLDDTTPATWEAAKRLHVTPTLTLWVATMRYCGIGLRQMPTTRQVISALEQTLGAREAS